MKNSINAHKARALEDADLLQMDLGLYTLAKDKDECWDGSEAQKALKDDVNNNRHVGLTAKQLQQTNDLYKPYNLKKFRDHLTQETRAKRESNYWLVKRKKAQDSKSEAIEDDFFMDWVNNNDG